MHKLHTELGGGVKAQNQDVNTIPSLERHPISPSGSSSSLQELRDADTKPTICLNHSQGQVDSRKKNLLSSKKQTKNIRDSRQDSLQSP